MKNNLRFRYLNNKIIGLVVFFSFFLHLIASSQEFYFHLSTGYGLPTYKNQVETFYDTETNNLTANVRQPAFSLGKGFYAGASFGFFATSNIGFDFGLQYHKGAKQNFNQQTMIISVLSNLDRSVFGNRFLINPSIILRAEPALITPFLKVGPSIGIINQRFEDVITVDTLVENMNWKFTGAASWGLNSTVGVFIDVSEKIKLSIELSHHVMTYKPEKADLQTAYLNGNRNDNSYLYFESHIVYSEWVEDSFNQNPPDTSKPSVLLTPTFSYHNFNMLLGVVFVL